MSKKCITCLILASLWLSGCVASQTKQTDYFPHWKPQLDQPISQLQERLAQLHQQQSMNYTSSNLAFLYDAKLYFLFHKLINKLPDAQRQTEIAAQRQWLIHRRAKTDAAYDQYREGTLASYVGDLAFIRITKKRIASIQRKIKAFAAKQGFGSSEKPGKF